jgi:MFS family permease
LKNRRSSDSETTSTNLIAEEEKYRDFVLGNLRRNYLAHLAHGLLGQTGFRLINAPTFIPAYVYFLSGSDIAVGIARSLQYLGMFLSPILSATLIEHRRRVLPIGFLVGGAMRIQVLGIALAGLLLPDFWALVAVCMFLGFFGFFLGMQGVIFSYLISKVIPVKRRGLLMGIRNTLSGITAAGVAYWGGRYLVGDNVLGDGYSATFGLAFILTALGLAMLGFVREPEPPQVLAPSRFRDRLRDLPDLLRDDRPFALYFLARALATMGRMAVPFYFLYGIKLVNVPEGKALGILTLSFLASQTFTNFLWGWIADRSGFRRVFLLSLSTWVFASILLMNSTSLVMLSISFFIVGAGLGGFMLSSQNMVLEFGKREDLPMRIALANSGSEFMGAVGPILGGILASTFSYPPVFWLAIAFKVAAILVVLAFVDEPRLREPV